MMLRRSLFLLSIILLSGCAIFSPSRRGEYRESGIASWYGEPFHGRKTANGETYDMYGISAAHRTLPFGTLVRVTDNDTGRHVDVRVNDRGPFVGGRILDLSYGAALALGMIGKGVANVTLSAVRMEPHAQNFLVQIGSFSDPENASRVKEKVEKYHEKVYIDTVKIEKGMVHRVRVGPFQSKDEAGRAMRRLLKQSDEWGTPDMILMGVD